MSDLAERLGDLALRNQEPLPSEQTYSDDEAKERFLDLLNEGVMPETAALKVGRTATWFRRRRKLGTVSYDESFAEAYEEAMRPDGLHREAIRGITRAALMKAVEAGDMRAIKVALQGYDPEFNFLRPQAALTGTSIENVLVLLGDVPTPVLQQLRSALVEQQKALPDIEA